MRIRRIAGKSMERGHCTAPLTVALVTPACAVLSFASRSRSAGPATPATGAVRRRRAAQLRAERVVRGESLPTLRADRSQGGHGGFADRRQGGKVRHGRPLGKEGEGGSGSGSGGIDGHNSNSKDYSPNDHSRRASPPIAAAHSNHDLTAFARYTQQPSPVVIPPKLLPPLISLSQRVHHANRAKRG